MASSIALTGSPTLMKLLSPSVAAPVSVALMKLLIPRIAATFSVRSLSTAIPPTTSGSDSVSSSKSDNESKVNFNSKQCHNDEACSLVNQFLKEGPSTPHKVMKDNKAVYARLDMPGIGKEGLKLWIKDNSLHVDGEEEVEKEYQMKYYPRKYYGNIEIPQGNYKLEEIVAELRNGVLKVKIPKNKNVVGFCLNRVWKRWVSARQKNFINVALE